MPVRSLSSSVLRWPDQEQVDIAVREWARRLLQRDPQVSRVGYTGSYARGNWGVGSDVDIIIIIHAIEEPFMERARRFDATALPVPADVLVYSESEWVGITGRRKGLEPVVWIA
jgi:uncharacterized protein